MSGRFHCIIAHTKPKNNVQPEIQVLVDRDVPICLRNMFDTTYVGNSGKSNARKICIHQYFCLRH